MQSVWSGAPRSSASQNGGASRHWSHAHACAEWLRHAVDVLKHWHGISPRSQLPSPTRRALTSSKAWATPAALQRMRKPRAT